MLFIFTKILPSTYLAQPGSSMAIRRSSRRSSADSSNPLFPKSCIICGKTRTQQNKKGIVPKKIFRLLAEVSIKIAAKDKMCDFYFQNNDLDLVALELLCRNLSINQLLSATAVVFEKLFQLSTLRKLGNMLFLLFP